MFICIKLKTMEERKLNEKESLELISQMISNTQQRFEKENASPFLTFGYATVLLSIVVWYLLKATDNPVWNLLWLSIPLLGYLGLKFIFPQRKKLMKTFVDKAIEYVWTVVGGCMLTFGILAMFIRIPIMFDIVLLMGIGVTLTGLLSKLKIIVIVGVLGILSSILFVYNVVEGVNIVLLFGAIFFVLMVIPGHILYARKGGKANV